MPKGEFRDALCLRFGWQIPNLPSAVLVVVFHQFATMNYEI